MNEYSCVDSECTSRIEKRRDINRNSTYARNGFGQIIQFFNGDLRLSFLVAKVLFAIRFGGPIDGCRFGCGGCFGHDLVSRVALSHSWGNPSVINERVRIDGSSLSFYDDEEELLWFSLSSWSKAFTINIYIYTVYILEYRRSILVSWL